MFFDKFLFYSFYAEVSTMFTTYIMKIKPVYLKFAPQVSSSHQTASSGL